MAPPSGWRGQNRQPNDVIGLDDIPDTSEFEKYSSPQPTDNNPQPQNVPQPEAQIPLPPMTTPTFAPVTPPAGGVSLNTGSPGSFGDDDDLVSPEVPSSGGSSGPSSHKPAYGPPEAEPDPEEIKRKENAMFKQLEGVVTPENIDGISNTLKAYGVDIPGDALKSVAPPLMPFLTKYGNRIMGGSDPAKFSELSAGASQIAEFFKDLQPVIGAIIAVILKPPTDASGKVVLRPEDEKNFDKLEGEVDGANLASFLQDGGDSSQSGLPSDMSPKRMTNDGRGATHEAYASPETPPRPKGPGELESIDELMEKARSTYGAAAFDGEMSAIRQRDEKMNAQPMKVSIQQELAAAKKREDDMRGTPAIMKDIPSLKPVTAQDVAKSNLGNKRPFTNEDGDEGVDSGESLDERDVDVNYDERDKQ